ncbi:Hsp20/alpha crystallin family protein [Protofrankia symbiont of Coriaria ruscifolia]|uniref:Heat shock protein Hsp20 n=1 Tax=Candidatus Protofrankia californiensis TaxID=1839754 RepID=A0A1C3NX67_9ACTN|nr:Hsp20/alpha crystallin family protein [Protofrankia symbiont of Coriaria ruscifolia]SBW22113.1 heat shock protein Hsp20 [Candidatus Protofrankia californiensis]
MSTYLWEPFAAFGRLDREFHEIVQRSWDASDRPRMPRVGFAPVADVVIDGNDVVVHLELPGADIDKDVAVELERGRLVIRGERADSRENDNGRVVVRERRYGAFHREFTLPEGVGADQISATYDKGVLSVRLAGALASAYGTRIPVIPGTFSALADAESSETSDSRPSEPVQAVEAEGMPGR